MTKFGETVKEDERRLGRGRDPRDVLTRGRWVNPLVGVLGAFPRRILDDWPPAGGDGARSAFR
jgi:hypothetical protein